MHITAVANYVVTGANYMPVEILASLTCANYRPVARQEQERQQVHVTITGQLGQRSNTHEAAPTEDPYNGRVKLRKLLPQRTNKNVWPKRCKLKLPSWGELLDQESELEQEAASDVTGQCRSNLACVQEKTRGESKLSVLFRDFHASKSRKAGRSFAKLPESLCVSYLVIQPVIPLHQRSVKKKAMISSVQLAEL